MAVNPNTGIDPEVDRFVYIEAFDSATFDPNDPSTYRVLNFNESWRADGEPRTGTNPRFMRFKKLPDDTAEADHRFTINSTPEMLVTGSLPVTDSSLPVGTYQVRQEAVKRPLEDLLAQIETEYQRQVRLQFPQSDDPALLLMGAGSLVQRQEGASLTQDDIERLSRVVTVGDRLKQLEARKNELVAAATADEDYDLTVWPNLT